MRSPLASQFLSPSRTSRTLRGISTVAGMALLTGATLGQASHTVWNMTLTSPSASGTNVLGSAITSGNNNGTISAGLLNTTSGTAATSYSGASAGNNAGAAARIGALNTGASGSAYFEVTLTPQNGSTLILERISFGSRATSTGPKAYAIRTSADAFAADYVTGTLETSGTWALKTNTGRPFSISSATTFRIYGHEGAGSPVAGTANWRIDDLTFTTSSSSGGTDTEPPTIATLNPADNGVNVAVPSTLQIGFSEAIAAGTGTVSIYKSNGDLVGSPLSVPSAAVVISGATATVTPSVALQTGTSYYVLITSGTFTDTASNAFTGITDVTTWGFSTIPPDTVAPTLVSFTPTNGATGVQPPTKLGITFNEPISQPAATGTTFVKVFKSVAGVPIEVASIDTAGFSGITATGNLAEISLGSTVLENGVTYTVQVDAGAFTDDASNGMASATWTFTTVAVPDLVLGLPYTQNFSTYTSATTLPEGWTFSGGSTLDGTYRGVWGTVTPDPSDAARTLGGFLGGSSVFGYHHTSLSNTATIGIPLTQTLTLRNATTDPITDLTVSYKGRFNLPANTRIPVYTVSVNGVTSSVLGYTTSDGDNAQRNASINIPAGIPAGATFQISWSSGYPTPGSGSARQIGISDVAVGIGTAVFAPTVASMSVPVVSIGSVAANVQANVIGGGGQTVSGRGFVYSVTSANAAPQIGGSGVTMVADGAPATGIFNASLSGLTPATSYSVSAYATNASGTSYTQAVTFITVGQSPTFVHSYTQEFSGITGNTGGITNMPAGWTTISDNVPPLQTYVGNWGTGSSSGGFLGGVTATPPSVPGVLGYRHTGNSGTLTVTLRLMNGTGATLTSLNVSYLGRAFVNATTPEGRSPRWEVKVAGSASVEALAYDTFAGTDSTKTTTITGLSIAAGEEFAITWTSDRDLTTGRSGSSKQIGLAQVSISNAAPPSGTLFSSWARDNTGSATADPAADHDGDGVSNALEYFMGATGSTFTPNRGIVGGEITWPLSPTFLGTYTVQTSANLSVWTPVSSTVVDHRVKYTPSGPGPLFIRMAVTPTATP
jgi:methionine-rich copper-binding protein CopC